jgi:hypothetical protein
MNNRNQNQRTLIPAATSAPAPASTYFNVFTVEEYESNGKPQKEMDQDRRGVPAQGRPGLFHRTEGLPGRRPLSRATARPDR